MKWQTKSSINEARVAKKINFEESITSLKNSSKINTHTKQIKKLKLHSEKVPLSVLKR